MAEKLTSADKIQLRQEKQQSLKELKRWFNANLSVEINQKTFDKIKKLQPFNPTQAIRIIGAEKSRGEKHTINYLMGQGYKKTYELKPQIKNFIEQNLTKKQKKDVSLNPRDLGVIITKNYASLMRRFENKYDKIAIAVGHNKTKSILKLNYEIRLLDPSLFKKLKNEDKIKIYERTKKEYEKYFRTSKAVNSFLDDYLTFGEPQSPQDGEETYLEELSNKADTMDQADIYSLDNIENYRDFEYNRNLNVKRVKNLINKYKKGDFRFNEHYTFSNGIKVEEFDPNKVDKKKKNLFHNLSISTAPFNAQRNAIKIGSIKPIKKVKQGIKRPEIKAVKKIKPIEPMKVGKYDNQKVQPRKNKISTRIKKRLKK